MPIGVQAVKNALAGRVHAPFRLEADDRLAAVAAVLRDGGDGAEVLLIRRAEQPGDPWSGHMAFPGGRRQDADRDLLHTAVRETLEEVGLVLEPERDLIGSLDHLPAYARGKRAGLVIAPFVFQLTGQPELVPSAREVDEVLWAPLSPLARGDRNRSMAWEYEGTRMQVPAFDVEGRLVWGLTHRMLSSLFAALDGAIRPEYETPR
jgi:8-oxo-dGTP pyrophosphatase MutT (NUDIX family)